MTPKSLGGLGIRDMLLIKSSVNMHHILPIFNNSNCLWFKVFIAKYNYPNLWNPNIKKFSSLWKGIY